ncbi:hypothetical protein SAMN05877753_12210 [Bacillus oleivorans]|uniref:Uncharacterized protein n=1 Tax=Bacillus oleivorans TaxID=1448271 RepID=A0A285D806_9BACI|nr:hypothetical protein [Bacillus oleivorans]SNX75922.1 hypothetical protein SAMN05877753_12210 [Bacillus oleivorans]
MSVIKNPPVQEESVTIENRIKFLESEVERKSKIIEDLSGESVRRYDQIIKLDAEVENQKKALETARKTLELYTKENEHLRGLLKLWM